MYIKTNNQQYRCTGVPTLSGDPLRLTLPDGGPETCGDTVGLYQDGGFLLRELDVSGYARREMQGTTLVITNQPEAEPAPEPEPEGMTLNEALAEAVAELTYRMDLQSLGLTEEGESNGQSA